MWCFWMLVDYLEVLGSISSPPVDLTAESWHWCPDCICLRRYDELCIALLLGFWDCFIPFPMATRQPQGGSGRARARGHCNGDMGHGTYRSAPYQISWIADSNGLPWADRFAFQSLNLEDPLFRLFFSKLSHTIACWQSNALSSAFLEGQRSKREPRTKP
jgi:hypothetical protein